MNANEIMDMGCEVIRTEMEGLEAVLSQMDQSFVEAAELLADLDGKVVLTGVGKSGIIAKKIAATMVSIGIPAMFMHPVEGLHGDLGVIMPRDVAIILSNSGNTKEISDLIPCLKHGGVRIIAITGGQDSLLAREADIFLSCHVPREACALGLAPTTSTTAQLALGDALSVVVSSLKGFDRASFRTFHPAGALGKQLMSTIEQVMITGEAVPCVTPDTPFVRALEEMNAKGLGFTLVCDDGHVQGIITDGDLRRLLSRHSDTARATAETVMTARPKTITVHKLALDALEMMESFQITSLCVVNDEQRLVGVVHLHDLLGRGRLTFRDA